MDIARLLRYYSHGFVDPAPHAALRMCADCNLGLLVKSNMDNGAWMGKKLVEESTTNNAIAECGGEKLFAIFQHFQDINFALFFSPLVPHSARERRKIKIKKNRLRKYGRQAGRQGSGISFSPL
jgi:hypothetical protein